MADLQVVKNKYAEKEAKKQPGFPMLFLCILLLLLSVGGIVGGAVLLEGGGYDIAGGLILAASIIVLTLGCLLFGGFKILNPNEAMVLTLFGKYYGTIKEDGFFWTNPFCTSINPSKEGKSSVTIEGVNFATPGIRKISLKTMTLNNEKQTVNDERGNPIIIGTIVIWKVVDTTKAVFNVQNYKVFLSTQCDSATRNISRQYPYDILGDDSSDEKTLRGSSQEIAEMMKKDLQERVSAAGLEIMEVRITHLSYAPEIAAAMLQRQQAEAVVAARKKIVEGAVGMVEMALEQLGEKDVIQLDEERKAAMVSNLLVVLCGNKDAQPIVNSGSIY